VASKIKAIALKKRVKAFLFNQTTEFEAIALKKSKEEKLLLHKKQPSGKKVSVTLACKR
jgi:hypothetical protein